MGVDFNEYYNLSCGTGAILNSIEMQKECEANYDYGQLAWVTWKRARGDIENADTTFVDAINEILQAPSNANNDYLGLGWTNTVLLGMGEQAQTTTLNDVFITRTTPSLSPTLNPTEVPTTVPTFTPTFLPTGAPTESPSQSPTASPSGTPSQSPTQAPSQSPSKSPTPTPTALPTNMPTLSPTRVCGPYVNDVQDLVFEGV